MLLWPPRNKSDHEDLATKMAIGCNLADMVCQEFKLPHERLQSWLAQMAAGDPGTKLPAKKFG